MGNYGIGVPMNVRCEGTIVLYHRNSIRDNTVGVFHAYGDTTDDYTILTSVGFPTAINPNKKLFKKLRDNKIDCKIIIERKDMIYRIDLMDKKSSFILNQ